MGEGGHRREGHHPGFPSVRTWGAVDHSRKRGGKGTQAAPLEILCRETATSPPYLGDVVVGLELL